MVAPYFLSVPMRGCETYIDSEDTQRNTYPGYYTPTVGAPRDDRTGNIPILPVRSAGRIFLHHVKTPVAVFQGNIFIVYKIDTRSRGVKLYVIVGKLLLRAWSSDVRYSTT